MTADTSVSGVTCAVLAGGRSRRMGVDKAFIELLGKPVIAWTLDPLRELGDEILIVANEPERYRNFGARVERDVIAGGGALGGLYSALYHASHERVLVVGCDMPLLSQPLLRYELSLSRDYQAVVPRVGEYVEPLHAVYARSCSEVVRRHLDAGAQRLMAFFSEISVRYVESDEIDIFDAEHLSFINVNTPEDLLIVRRLLETRCLT